MATDTEAVFRLQLQELEQGRGAFDDLEYAYRFQLAEALEASRAHTQASSRLQGQAVRHGSHSLLGLDAESQTDLHQTLHRDLLEAQARQKGLSSEAGSPVEG